MTTPGSTTRYRVVALILVVLAIFGATALPSVAASLDRPVQVAAINATDDSYNGSLSLCDGPQAASASSTFLPINRWADASQSLHTRLSASMMGDWAQKLQRNTQDSSGLSLGNAMWRGTAGLTEFAARFCLAEGVGRQADVMAASLGDAIKSSGLLIIAIVIGVIGILVKTLSRSAQPLKSFVRIGVTVGAFAILLAGAQGTAAQSAGFGKFSPGWWGSVVNDTISSVAATPANALNAQVKGITVGASTIDSSTSLNCTRYVNELIRQYDAAYGGNLNSQAAIVPKSVDAMWRATGLRAYINAQFGTMNSYGDLMYCRALEQAAGIPAGQWSVTVGTDPLTGAPQSIDVPGQIKLTQNAAGNAPNIVPGALVWNTTDDLRVDRSLVAWAACRWNGSAWKVDSGWSGISPPTKGSAPTADDCTSWWTSTDDGSASAFEWQDSESDITTAALPSSVAVANYLYSLHGNAPANGTAATTIILYVIASMIVAVVFGIMSLAVIIAKLGLLGLTIFALLALLAGLFSPTGENRLVVLAKHYVSMAMFAFMAGLIMSFVAILTQFIAASGVAVSGSGSAMSVLWTGLAPVAACFMAHYVITKVFKAPSPFKLSSGLAWGAAGAGAGMAAGIGLDRMFRRATYRGRGFAQGAGNAVANRVLGRRPSSRRNGLQAAGGNGPGSERPATGRDRRTERPQQGAAEGSGGPTQDSPELDPATVAAARTWRARGHRDLPEGQSRAGALVTDAKLRVAAGRQRARHKVREVGARASAVFVAARRRPLRSAFAAARKLPLRKGLKVAGVTAAVLSLPVATVPAAAAVGAVWANRKIRQRSVQREAGADSRRRTKDAELVRQYLDSRPKTPLERPVATHTDTHAPVVEPDVPSPAPQDGQPAPRRKPSARSTTQVPVEPGPQDRTPTPRISLDEYRQSQSTVTPPPPSRTGQRRGRRTR